MVMIQEVTTRECAIIKQVASYFEVIKPLSSVLLAFIGVAAAFIAGRGLFSFRLLIIAGVIFIAAAGANGLTNYLDRDLDARMQRTRHRVLPSGRISPPEKALAFVTVLIVTGLVLAWRIHPLVFLADLAGTLAAGTWRKRITCVYPQGVIASCAPVAMGWLAARPSFNWELVLLCIMIVAWLPLHVWSVIIAHREDYLQAGLDFFPVNCAVKDSVKVLLVFALLLFIAAAGLYFVGDYTWRYLLAAVLLGAAMVYATFRLVISQAAADAWRLYKLSALPYLGLLFVAMSLDIVLSP